MVAVGSRMHLFRHRNFWPNLDPSTVKKLFQNGNRPGRQIFSNFIEQQTLRELIENHIPIAEDTIRELNESLDAFVINKSVMRYHQEE